MPTDADDGNAWQPIEQAAGPPLVKPADPAGVGPSDPVVYLDFTYLLNPLPFRRDVDGQLGDPELNVLLGRVEQARLGRGRVGHLCLRRSGDRGRPDALRHVRPGQGLRRRRVRGDHRFERRFDRSRGRINIVVIEAESGFQPQAVAGTEPDRHDIAACEQLFDDLNSTIGGDR